MNKRSAVFMSAGLVAVLMLGGLAFSLGLTGPAVSAASTRSTSAQVQPVVRTHTKKIVVHRQAPTPPARTVIMPAPSTYTGSATTGGYEDDDGYEGDDHFEGSEHGGGGDD
jgi:hypothetical protein